MALRFSPLTRRLAIGALLGVLGWLIVSRALPFLPFPVAFLLGWLVFTFGPGCALGWRLTRDLEPLSRGIVLLGIGSAATPVLIDLLGRAHLVPIFPYVAAALAGSGLAAWNDPSDRVARMDAKDAVAATGLIALALALGALVFWHRLQYASGGVVLYGDYDTADLAYYAAEASEASHTVPPLASYYAGHQLNAAYYPHLVLGMIHRFLAVPVLLIYFRYAWPTFLALNALTIFALVRTLASRGIAVLSAALILVGSDFSYLAAWLLPHADFNWDYVLWPTNFLSPTMHVMHFATWGPSLPVFFTALYAIVRGIQARSRGWLVLSAFLIAVLFQFKPFSYIVLMAGLCAAALFSVGDWTARRRFAATIGLGILFSLPFLFLAATVDPDDRRSQLVIDFLLLPRRMLLTIDVTGQFERAANWLAPWAPLRTPIFLILATVVFLAVGVAMRWIGAPGVWRAIRDRTPNADTAAWRLLAWVVVAGIGIPFVLATEPYVDTLQFHLTGLYIMWIFTAVALIAFTENHPKIGCLAIAAVFALALPSSVHYLARKWNDAGRPP